jgi:protein phosphatase 2C family protein 2/3
LLLTHNAGIWDCLSSQDVVDFVRLHVSQGKELVEIGELMCEHCLAPDTTYRAGIGCDNMTVLIVAILNGRNKEEWYNWVTQRVKDNYGYETPSPVRQIYAQSRLAAFKVRRDAQEARERARQEKIESDSEDVGASPTFGGFSPEVESTGGISFHPSTGIVSDNGTLMFTHDESDDDDSGDEFEVTDIGRLLYNNTSGMVRADVSSATYSLKSRLDAFEQDTRQEGGNGFDLPIDDLELDNLISSHAPPTDSPNHVDSPADAPNDPPPKAQPNGDAGTADSPKPQPGGEPSPSSDDDVVMQPPPAAPE